MGDLLASDFARLIKSQVFRGVLIFCVESIIFEVIINRINNDLNRTLLDGLLSTNFIIIGILLSVFIGLFIGSEYSDGTMRNKLIAGNSRANVYLSNFIICTIAGFIIQAVNFITISVISVSLYGLGIFPLTPQNIKRITNITERQLVGFYIVAAYTALFVMLTMLICSKPIGTATVMVLAVVMLISGMSIDSAVSEYDPSKVTDETSSISSESESVEYQNEYMITTYRSNSKKELSGFKLKAYLTLDKVLPTAQSQKLTKHNALKNPDDYALYDIIITFVSTFLGIIVFNRKDLK